MKLEQSSSSDSYGDSGIHQEISPYNTVELVFIILPLSLICLTIFLGNLLVILAVTTQVTLRTIPNFFLVSLALADISVGVFIMPLAIVQIATKSWTMGAQLCHVWLMGDVTLCTVSILHLCVIAIDRYRTIIDGISYMHRRTLKTTLWTIFGIWIVALWIASPPLLGWHDWHQHPAGECHLSTKTGYVIHSALGSLVFPLGLMIVLYVKIYHAIQRRLRERVKMGKSEMSALSVSGDQLLDENQQPHTQQSEQIKAIIKAKQKFSLSKERRAARTLGIIMGAFLVCWLPFGIIYVLEPFLPEDYRPSDVIYGLVTWLGYLNSALNPIIYTVFSLEFRRGFKRVLHIA